MSIAWDDPSCPVSRYFKVKDALYLPQWKRLATPDDGLTYQGMIALEDLFARMDQVRDFLGVPIIVHCAYRPPGYNALVGGAKGSCHMARIDEGVKLAAVDFHAEVEQVGQAEGCDVVKDALKPRLEAFGLRMEDNGELATWVHLDTRPVRAGGHRVFKP